MNILIIGKPGSGKGTITQKLIEENSNFIQLSTGDLLRKEQGKRTKIGDEITRLLLEGKFATDEIIFPLVNSFLLENNGKSIIFDGFPRNLVQAEACIKNNVLFDHIFVINASDEEVTKRIETRFIHKKSGRVYNSITMPPKVPGFDDLTGEALTQRYDDKPDIIKIRLADYKKLTEPIIGYLANTYKINYINSVDLKEQIAIVKETIVNRNKTNRHGI
jgi:adenylate kinase